MRKYGYIGNAYFSHQGFSIRNLAEEYKIVCNDETRSVYVNSMSELKHEIAQIYGEKESELQEKDEIQVRSLSDSGQKTTESSY